MMGISWMMMCCSSSSTMRRTSPTEGRFSFGYVAWGLFFFCGSVWNGGSRYSKKVFGRIQILWIFEENTFSDHVAQYPNVGIIFNFISTQYFKETHPCIEQSLEGILSEWWIAGVPFNQQRFFRMMLFWKSQLAICHVETIFWWSGTLLELFSENDKRARSWDYLEKWHFFVGEKIGEGILENLSSAKKGIFQVKRWGFWPPQKPYLKAAWHEESVQESSHWLGNLDFRCPNVRDPLNWLTFVCWKPILLVVISVRSCSPMLTEQCWTTMGRTERHRGPKMLSCSVVFFPQAGMVSTLKLWEEQKF